LQQFLNVGSCFVDQDSSRCARIEDRMKAHEEIEETEEEAASADVDSADDIPHWVGRRWASVVVKSLAFLIPLALSIGWTVVMTRALPPASGLPGNLGWWTVVAGGALVLGLIVERATRRLLPMAMLLRLSLVFPESTPSRFGMALRANSVRQLRRRIDAGVVDESDTPQEAATSLLELSAALSAHDRMARGHAERVRAYSFMIGTELELTDGELDKLQWAALLHDVGKLDVSIDILNKRAKPNNREFAELNTHSDTGDRYVQPLRAWLGDWADAASQHHERFDGTGYPAALAGEDISLSGRIVAVADAYDVMTSTRSYKKPMKEAAAREELLECSGTQFDPDIVRAFLTVPVSEIKQPMRAAAGAGILAPIMQIMDLRTASAGAAAIASAVVGITLASSPVPEALAFTQATPTKVEIIEDQAINIPLQTNSPADKFTIDSVDGPATASVNDAILRIEPLKEQSGTVTVVLTACRSNECDTTTIVAEVVSVNDPPLAGTDSASTTGSQQSVIIPVLENDTDADNEVLFILRAELAVGGGRVEIISDGQELLFTPDVGSYGPWSIEYVVTDGGDGFDQGTVTILDGDLAPEAVDDTATVTIGETIRIDPRSNDLDDGGNSSLVIVAADLSNSAPVGSSVTVEEGSILVFTAGAEPGLAEITYVIEDRMQRDSAGKVRVEITGVLPEAVDDEATTKEDTAVVIDVLANDGPDVSALDPETLRIVSSSSGSVSITDAQIRYEPPADAAGQAQVTYEICTISGDCDSAVVTITVTPVQDATPFAADGELQVPSNAGAQAIPWVVVSSGQTSIVPGTTFLISTDRPELFTTAPAISSAGVLSFNPLPGANATANATITVNDSENGRRIYRLRLVIS
jgi:HD-GYP domain-containing protein (c-di-GMP phosphodiesterase class II)